MKCSATLLWVTAMVAVVLVHAGCNGETSSSRCFATCSGCCMGELCEPAPDESACGANGGVCVACSSGEQCIEGQCVPGQQCNAQTCPTGCCQGGLCVERPSSSQCGTSGMPCIACAPTDYCREGQCIAMGTCDAASCPNGCCDGNTCVTTPSDGKCGIGGNPCTSCSDKGMVCNPASRTCCKPDCSGKCPGADNGCGSLCTERDCPGCCDGTLCIASTTDAKCGSGGATCSDCTQSGGTCTGGTCSNCTPNCAGKCAGADDGCGGNCPSNQCSGCCDGISCETGAADQLCGSGGGPCANCTSSGTSCTSGSCGSTCSPDCAGKCTGDSDGCGGTCTTNQCTGCCGEFTKYCFAGTDALCGANGATCDFCDTTETCISGVCTPSTTDPCSGAPNGTTSCTDGSGSKGVCYDGSCCTGCWRTASGSCVTGFDSAACGDDGRGCTDCTISGQSCSGGTCISNNPCQGLTGGTTTCTDDAGLPGKCWYNQCCATCWDSQTSTCVSTPTNDNCGTAGAACVDCTATSQVCSGATCVTSSTSVCTGKSDFTSCNEGGKSGVCIQQECCTTCYYISGGTAQCSFSGSHWLYCGAGGKACEECNYPADCFNYACEYPPSSLWTLQVSKAFITNMEPTYYWDSNQGQPDIFAVIDFDTSRCTTNWMMVPTSQTTSTQNDTYTPVWNHDISPVKLSDMREFCVSLLDDDTWPLPNELIANCKVEIHDIDLDFRDAYQFDCPNPDDNVDYVQSIMFTLTPQ